MSANLLAVETLYAEILQAKLSAETALTKIPESLLPLVDKMRGLERQLRELYIAQAAKNMPVQIGAEGEATLSDILNEELPAHQLAIRARVKEKARKLMSRYHPDKGGDPVKFDTLKKAIHDGDMEYVHMCLHKESFYSDLSLSELHDRLTARLQQTRGQPSFKLARLYFSGSPQFAVELEKVLMIRINQLSLQVLGIS